MRARHRHFNPAHAGAYSALDSRFGFSLADNDPINAWEDRSSGNKDATGTSTSRPLYKVNAMNGNPVVRFDGTNDYLKVDTVTASKVTLLSVVKTSQTGTTQLCIQWGFPGNDNQFHLWITSSRYGCFYRDSVGMDRGITAADNKTSDPTIISTLFDSVQRIWENGKAGGTANTNGTLNQSAASIGIGVKLNQSGNPADPAYLNGDMGQMVIIPSAIENPLRKRLEHAAAYSFKIACN